MDPNCIYEIKAHNFSLSFADGGLKEVKII